VFTIAHLSDPHLAPLPRPRVAELMSKRVTGYINWWRNRRFIHDRAVLDKIVADLKAQGADHIAVTGDLTNISLPEEFTRALAWLEAIGPASDVTVIPGNHDAYVHSAAHAAERVWNGYMRGDDAQPVHSRASGNPEPASQSQQFPSLGPRSRGDERNFRGFPFVRRRGPLALIGLSTAVPTGLGMATGRVGAEQLAALAATLDAQKDALRVVLIHHPPVSKAAHHKLLTDAPEFLRVIAAHGADLVLHGHDHLGMLNWLEGPGGAKVPAVGVPSASAAPGMAKNAAAYNLYRIEGTPGAMRCEMIARGIGANGDVVEQKRMMLVT